MKKNRHPTISELSEIHNHIQEKRGHKKQRKIEVTIYSFMRRNEADKNSTTYK